MTTNDDKEECLVRPCQYVGICIDIHTTLIHEFWAQSVHGEIGTFPMDSLETIVQVSSLVDEFLHEIEFPINDSSRRELNEFECPVFCPQTHLVMITHVYDQQGLISIEFQRVENTLDVGSSPNQMKFNNILRPAFIPLLSPNCAPLESSKTSFQTTADLQIPHTACQNVHDRESLILGRVIGEPSDSISLNWESIQTWKRVVPSLKKSIEDELLDLGAYDDDRPNPTTLCGCLEKSHYNNLRWHGISYTTLSDVVVDVTHASLLNWTTLSIGASLELEQERTVMTAELFVRWLQMRAEKENQMPSTNLRD